MSFASTGLPALGLAAMYEAHEKGKKNKPRRVQLDLPEGSFERLNALKDQCEAVSYTEVVKNALRLYEYMIKQADSGIAFYEKDPVTGALTPIKILS